MLTNCRRLISMVKILVILDYLYITVNFVHIQAQVCTNYHQSMRFRKENVMKAAQIGGRFLDLY